ncbi:MAG: 2,3,4,5-tetrahydropyridine-2,6-dicarboxylate N-succinyltransferase, partial [Polyangiaceae bacterium]|nr:2,3,4,5-tetrahydropyridine-2,6-dicarboxylate N-succinyltransferase [Polyangiaceae bacterium]
MTDAAKALEPLVREAFEDRKKLDAPEYRAAVEETIALLDRGVLRVASRGDDGAWTVHAFTKQAILLYFGLRKMEKLEVGPFEFFDKIPLKRDLEAQGVRVVPPGTVRYGAHMERGTVLMPGYVNIGAFVGEGTMVDTWATVGSCA